jgi:hypothetical protein
MTSVGRDESELEVGESTDMSNSNEHSRRCRFRPAVTEAGSGADVLDRRLLLSGGMATVIGHGQAAVRPEPKEAHAAHHVKLTPKASHPAHPVKVSHTAKLLTPAQEIDAQYAAFLAAFRTVEDSYVTSLTEQSSNTVAVTTTVTAPYVAGAPVIQVDDAAVFGPAGNFNPVVTATASVGGVTIGQFVLNGSSGNQLIVDPSISSDIPLNVGTVLSATVPASAQSSAATIFPSYIQASTYQLAVNLVEYFNDLPIPLPNKVTSSHEPQQPGAIQEFVYQQVAGSGTRSLEQLLATITLPTTPGADLQIYDATVATAVNASRLQTLNAVKQIFTGAWQIQPLTASSTTTSGTSSTTTTSSTTA